MSIGAKIRLDGRFEAFVEGLIAEGYYSDADEVVTAALRLLEIQETRLSALRRALIEGENSGPAARFDFEDFIARAREAEDAI